MIDVSVLSAQELEAPRKISDLAIRERPQKHRYIYFNGSKSFKKKMNRLLNYNIKPYPKGNNKRYDASYKPKVQGKLF